MSKILQACDIHGAGAADQMLIVPLLNGRKKLNANVLHFEDNHFFKNNIFSRSHSQLICDIIVEYKFWI